jgi:hypothetical protein
MASGICAAGEATADEPAARRQRPSPGTRPVSGAAAVKEFTHGLQMIDAVGINGTVHRQDEEQFGTRIA